ncbi:MAG: 30S ribosomal protein S6 [Candidatus Neomarinimicrobiota bacterium]
MRYYEAIYIAHPNLEQEDLSKLIEETKGMLKKRGCELLHEEVLGKKRLAYPIQKQRFGTYVLLQFQGDGISNAGLNQDLELNDNILAHMIVRIDEDEIRETRVEESKEELVFVEGQELPAGMEEGEAEEEEPSQPRPEIAPADSTSNEETEFSEEKDLEPEIKE